MYSENPADLAREVIALIIGVGSSKDGRNEAWREEPEMYHLVKAISHLASHIKQVYDPRAHDGENHLHRAMARCAMANQIETKKKIYNE